MAGARAGYSRKPVFQLNLKLVCGLTAVFAAFFAGRGLGVRQARVDRINKLDAECREADREIGKIHRNMLGFFREERDEREKWFKAFRSAVEDRGREGAKRAKHGEAKPDTLQK